LQSSYRERDWRRCESLRQDPPRAMEIAVLVGAKAVIGYTAITIGTWDASPPAPRVRQNP